MKLLRAVNAPLEQVNYLIRKAIARRLYRPESAAIPVISVGNIAMGGTGKTPLVEALARTLLEQGKHPAILTRGYKRRHAAPFVLRGDPGAQWSLAGDEPSLLAKHLPQVPVVVDRDRRRGAHCAVRLGATHAILDDGFQHWPLARELDLVVVDAKDPLGLRTLRREPPAALRWASRLVCVGEPEEQDGARRLLAPYHPLPPFPARLVPLGWIWQGQVHPLQLLRQRRFVAFAGIARPGRFFHTLQGLGANLVHRRGFADHHPYTPRQLATLLQLAHRLDAMLITTAKDHVRVPEPFAHQVAYLEVALVPLEESFATLLGPFGLVG